MAMLEGVITINAATGATTVKTGCAGEVFDVLDAGSSWGTLASANPIAYAAARTQLAVMARAIAKVVLHVQVNAVATSVVASGIVVATTGTAAAQAGTTTGTGTATGTIA